MPIIFDDAVSGLPQSSCRGETLTSETIPESKPLDCEFISAWYLESDKVSSGI